MEFLIKPKDHQLFYPNFICSFGDSIVEYEAIFTETEPKLWQLLPIIGRRIHPYGPFHLFWRFLTVLMLICVCLGWPFVMSFNFELRLAYWQGILALVFDAFLIADIILNFFVAYYDPNDHLRLITDFKKIKHRYLKRWFIIDLLSSLPYELMYIHRGGDLAYILRFLKVLNFLRLMRYINVFTKYVVTPNGKIRVCWKIFRLLCLMLFSVHAFACLWFSVGKDQYEKGLTSWVDENNANIMIKTTTFRKYCASAYWSVVTLSTVGLSFFFPLVVFFVGLSDRRNVNAKTKKGCNIETITFHTSCFRTCLFAGFFWFFGFLVCFLSKRVW